MNDARTATNAFFETYRIAFERADATGIVDLLAFPCHITSEAEEIRLTTIASRTDGLRLVEQILAMYRHIRVVSARALDVAASDISPRLIQALVHWALYDEAGDMLYAFEAAYTLARIDGALRIGAIAHNEIPRYRECLARINPRTTGHAPG